MSDAERLRAELAVAELEEQLVEAKKGRKKNQFDDQDYLDLKAEVRAARQEYRELRDAGVANPEPAKAKAKTGGSK